MQERNHTENAAKTKYQPFARLKIDQGNATIEIAAQTLEELLLEWKFLKKLDFAGTNKNPRYTIDNGVTWVTMK